MGFDDLFCPVVIAAVDKDKLHFVEGSEPGEVRPIDMIAHPAFRALDVKDDMDSSWRALSRDGAAGFERDDMVLCEQMLEKRDCGGLDQRLPARDADMTPAETANLVEDERERLLFSLPQAEPAIAPPAAERTARESDEGRHNSG